MAVKIGDKAPDFTLPTTSPGEKITLSEANKGKNIDKNGIVQYARVSDDPKVKPSVSEIKETLAKLK